MATRVALQLDTGVVGPKDGDPRAGPELEVDFWELDGAADGLLIGAPTLADWGFGLERDERGRTWVLLSRFGFGSSPTRTVR